MTTFLWFFLPVVVLTGALQLYLRYYGKAEELRVIIRDKTFVGVTVRSRVYFLVIRVNGRDLRCNTTAATWRKAQPGSFATITLMRGNFVRSLTMQRPLRPEEFLRLQREIIQKGS